MQPVLDRGDDARLVCPVERVAGQRLRTGRGGARAVPVDRYRPGRPGRDAGQADTGGAEDAAPRDSPGPVRLEIGCVRGHHLMIAQTTAAANLDSGSDSALTALDRSLTSVLLSSS